MTKDKRKKVLFIIPSLAGGGAEQILIHLLRNLNRNSFHPILVVFNKTGPYTNQIPNDVVTFDLIKKNWLDFFRLINQMSKIIQREEQFWQH